MYWKQRGFNIIELLVVMAISILLSLGFIFALQTMKKQFLMLNELVDILNKKEQFYHLIMGYIHEATFAGCRSLQLDSPVTIYDDQHFSVHRFENIKIKYPDAAQGNTFSNCFSVDDEIKPWAKFVNIPHQVHFFLKKNKLYLAVDEQRSEVLFEQVKDIQVSISGEQLFHISISFVTQHLSRRLQYLGKFEFDVSLRRTSEN